MKKNRKKIFLRSRKTLLTMFTMFLFLEAFAQSTSIKGIVVDASSHEPLIGVAIVQKGMTNGTISDIDGNFTLEAPLGSILVASYIGYQKQEVKAAANMRITLSEDTQALNEVVVVGFGVQKKVNLTGAVGTASSKDFESRPVSSATLALQGVVPGLNISNSGKGGELNGKKAINIRGSGTIGDFSSGEPLILIDGMEGDINTINPQDIDNISVLKDAAAASIYGSRAPFGVILITTKKGKAGRAVINYNNSFRFNTPIKLPKMMSSWEYVNFYDDAMYNKNNTHYYTEEYKQKVRDYYEGKLAPNDVAKAQGNGKWDYDFTWGNVDWLQEYFREWAPSQEHNASVSGGADKMTYYLSANYLDQSGFMRYGTDNYKRYNLTAKISSQLTKYVQLDYMTRYVRADYSRPAVMYNDFYNNVLRRTRPVRPVYDPNGYYMSDINYIGALKDGGRHKDQNDGLVQQGRLTFTPIKNWNIIGEMNVKIDNNWNHWDHKIVYSHYADDPEKIYAATMTGYSQNAVSEYSYKGTFLNPNIYSNYHFNLDKHGFAVTGGFQSEQQKYRNVTAQRSDMISTDMPVLNLTTNNVANFGISGAYEEWANAGFFSRVNYDFDGRYLFEGNLRYDGSSRFRSEDRWILTPSFSLGWNMAREDFWKPLANKIETFKFRMSYGALANQNTNSLYPTYRIIDVNSANGNWLINGAKPNTANAPKLVTSTLTWEKVKTTNFGFDVSSLNGRLTGSFDYFVRKTEDMLGPGIELPASLGTDVPRTNNTDLKTKGWELQVEWRDRIQDFSYGVRLNLSDARSKVLRYGNPTGNLGTYLKGEWIGNIYGYTTLGIAKTDEEMKAHLATMTNGGQDGLGSQWTAGDIMYADLNGDGKINNGSYTLNDMGDMKKIGNNTPRYLFGFNMNAAWKGVDVQMFWQGVLKRDYWPGDNNMTFWGVTDGEWWSTAFKAHLDYFRTSDNPLGENLNSYYPRPIFNTKNNKVQTRYLQNAAYARLKNLQLGYTLPKKLTNALKLQNLRVFFSGENLLTITNLSDTMDPETVGIGIQDNSQANSTVYPLSKTYSFGLSVNF
ncbi:TonB-linked SusC/RagA family outer membrane protein [Dysgonomonas alginatilytica]|uniref:TonB-linked SusC/RagA family outer membrane protein n=1 Tax=Dysgonomonas alginatilytica TaxID=1605892 RepID=A0A2V3PI63_9BACT|nr:TonB-dependent receptor [Dysgonomonas alginatilytica]PXV59284.1 TonB-linked SusC/RagA family outer membrane protein [Dysgonomonas alginatilytica]